MKSKLKIPRKLNKTIKEFVIDKKNGKKVRVLLPPSRNSATLASFALYCSENPELRFWQALRNWSGYSFVLVADGIEFSDTIKYKKVHDTFYWGERYA